MIKRNEKALLSVLKEKYPDEFLVVKYENSEDLNKPVPVRLLASSEDESELYAVVDEYTLNEGNTDKVLIASGEDVYKDFVGGFPI